VPVKVPVKSIPGNDSNALLRYYSAITRDDGIRSPFGVAGTPKAAFSFIASDRKSEIMKRRFILYRRKLGGTFSVEDTEMSLNS
jgi:hypothetical protein